MSNGWEKYIYEMENKYSKLKSDYTINNCTIHSAIYGSDGELWAKSKEWPGLSTYEH